MILVAGYAACGKSFVSRRLAEELGNCCYLDKDTLAAPLADRLLEALGQGKGDRDSETYRRLVRPLEYECLMAAALEASAYADYVILSSPFLSQLADEDWMGGLQCQADKRQLALRFVWVHCDYAQLRERMIERGSPRDVAKLATWKTYSQMVDMEFPRRLRLMCHVFDNAGCADFEVEMCRLINYVTT
jgi:predicted kinase